MGPYTAATPLSTSETLLPKWGLALSGVTLQRIRLRVRGEVPGVSMLR